MSTALSTTGYELIRRTGADPLQGILSCLRTAEPSVVRDVTIGPEVEDELRPHPGDFWFHTDGVFWTVPPRWVVIQVLRADEGGQLEVLDGAGLRSLPPDECSFGARHRICAPVAAVTRVRYRRDYMHSVPHGLDVARAHRAVERSAGSATRISPDLVEGDCLLLDNWRMLHRRLPFRGVRRIRRVWAGGRP